MRTSTTLFLLYLAAATSNAQWIQTYGPSGASLGSMVADTVGHVYAASDSQWFRSTNDCATWESMPISTPEWDGGRFCIGRGNIVFAGTTRGVSRSSNFGVTWVKAGLVDTPVTALHCGADGTLYAGTAPLLPQNTWRASVSRSTDNGLSWVQCAPTWAPSTVEAIATTPQGTMFVAEISHITTSGSIMRSTDAGLHWDTVYQAVRENIVTLAIGSDGTIFAGTMSMMGPGGNALRSTDNGQTWASVQAGLPGAEVWSFVFAGSGQVYLSTTGVFGSSDKGTTWTPAKAGLPQTRVLALAKSGINLFAGTSGSGIWRIPLSEVTAVVQPYFSRPAEYVLSQNYPNPFNPGTNIRYELPKTSHVGLTVYDLLGREVSVLVNDRREAGVHEVKFDGSGLASGVYFYRLRAGDFVATKRLHLLK